MKTRRAAVIGGGLGGLSAAINLARRGVAVELFDNGREPGGKAGSIKRGGYRFDTGPSLFTMPHVVKELFSDAKESIDDYLALLPLEEHCRYAYPDGTRLSAFDEVTRFAAEVEAHTNDTAASLENYLAYSRTIYDLTAEMFLYHDFHELDTFRGDSSLETLKNIRKIDSLRTVHRANRSFFTDPRMVQLFDRYATYNGSDPYRAPATLNIIPHVEHTMGSYVIDGGMIALPRALARLAEKKGVIIHRSTPVEAIERKGKTVTGIRVKGEVIPFDIIVSNADVTTTYRDLLADTRSWNARRYRRLEPSSSALVFYWGMKKTFNNLGTHNILFSGDYRAEFKSLFKEKKCPDDPTIYIYISSKFAPGDAPRDSENWFVMINAPYDAGQNWQKEKEQARGAITKKIKDLLDIDVDHHLAVEESATPPDIAAATGSHRGALYGISSNSKSAAFMRHANRSRRYRGLYFCGGSAHPGGGIPLAILSGRIAADLVEKYELGDGS